MRTVYEAGRQLWKLRFLMLLMPALGIACVAYGIDIMKTYGLRPADGGVLKPLHVRLAFGGGMGLVGLGATAGMALYSRRYVARLELDDTTGEVHLLTPGLFGVRRLVLRRDDFGRGRYYHGRFEAGYRRVNAPWWTMPVRGYRIPFLLDAQGVVRDHRAVGSLLRLRGADVELLRAQSSTAMTSAASHKRKPARRRG